MLGEVLIGGMASLLICCFLGPKFIEFIRNREFGQQIREEGPKGHHGKAGTSRYCRPMPMVTPPERTPYVPQVVAGRMPVPVHTGSLTPDPFGVEKMQTPMSYAGQ